MKTILCALAAMVLTGPALHAFDADGLNRRPGKRGIERILREAKETQRAIAGDLKRLERLRGRYAESRARDLVEEERMDIHSRVRDGLENLKRLEDQLNRIRKDPDFAFRAAPADRARAADQLFEVSVNIRGLRENADKTLDKDAQIFSKSAVAAEGSGGPVKRLPPPLRLLILIVAFAAAVGWRLRRKKDGAPAVLPNGPPQTALLAAASAANAPEISLGTVLNGNYRIEGELGRGGMGVVYAAKDITLDRKVAIKCMLKEVSESAWELEQFIAEARMVAALKNPLVVEIYSIFREGGRLFLVFEHVEGQPLNRYLSGKPMNLRLALRLFHQVAVALDYAHGCKVIHRDLKPSNIMVTPQGMVKVMDFGIAHQAKMTVARVTRANAWGTPAYMAPEQELGTISRESDLFALGVCLYELVTGKIPFTGPNFLAQKQQAIYPRASDTTPGLPKEVDAVLVKAMSPDPSQRYHSGAEFVTALKAIRC